MEVRVSIEAIEIAAFDIKPKPPDISTQQFKIDVGISTILDPPKKFAITITNVGIKDNNGVLTLGNFAVWFIFKIENFEEVFPIENDAYIIPDEVRNTLNSISISTVRGMMLTMLKGTYLHKAIIPIVDVSLLHVVMPPEPEKATAKEKSTEE